MKKQRKKVSLQSRLIQAFFITSIIPVILVNLFSYFNTSNIVRDNMEELARVNLQQTSSTLDVWLESYGDILFQLYTDDDIVALIDKINRGEDEAVSKNQLRRTLHSLFFAKEYIQSISVLTDNGTMVFYDRMSGSGTRNSWESDAKFTRQELYELVSADNDTHIFSTQRALEAGIDTKYVFHLGHRIIDYRDLPKRIGIVIVSIDEELLSSVCNNSEGGKNSYNFIVDSEGRMVSCLQKELLESRVITWDEDVEERKKAYKEFVQSQRLVESQYVSVDVIHDEEFNWDIVNVTSREEVIGRLNGQLQIMMTVLTVSLVALVIIILILTKRLSGSLKNMIPVMEKAGKGDLSARVEIERSMPEEAETIAQEFNHMLGRLSQSIEKEQEAGERQKQAEIAALEAQINPHFLYNTLDTINWMAIDKEEYEISNSINALANILRYGIDNSNGIVTVKEEYEWLKKYLFLQQTRLKNTFQCEIHVEPELMEKPIHKLLLQPFVENSILHGFDGVERTHFLSIDILREKNSIKIVIYDNGKGIPEELVSQMNQGIFPETVQKNHIGMENAINRIKMYYGEKGHSYLESRQGEYTRVCLEIPLEE